MPVYLDRFTLVLDKKVVSEKFNGGIENFRKKFIYPSSTINQEDDELFSLGQINYDGFYLDGLIDNGLDYDFEKEISDDFVIIYKGEGKLWEADWLEHNTVFAWHKDTCPTLKQRVEEISNMTYGYVLEQQEKGNNLLSPIRLGR